MKKYKQGFYASRHQKSVFAAQTILDLLLAIIPPVRSAVDVGCGVGTWLSVLQERNVADVLGIDGPWVDRALLEIPSATFVEADLTRALPVSRRFDLALSLEVAEHLPAQSAAPFVASLTALADFVLFSAAIPGQGGRHHLNEQWPTYWAELFAQHDYVVLDCIRAQIWEIDRIPAWYRQNILLFVKSARRAELKMPVALASAPLSLVHPQSFAEKVRDQSSVGASWTVFRRALKKSLQGKLGILSGSRS